MTIPTVPKVTLPDLTVATLAGTGVFDTLMRAAKTHLDQEYTNNRIKGSDYASVYLGSMTQVLAQSVEFLLSKDKAQYDAQIAEAQVRLTEAQIRLVEKQIEKEDQEAALRAAQVLLINAQRVQTDAQSALTIQKTITEKAQTQAAGVDVDSVVGKQKTLYTAQTDGYRRDSEQRVAKLMADTWVARRTTDEGTIADGTNLLNDASIGLAISKLLEGVGIVV